MSSFRRAPFTLGTRPTKPRVVLADDHVAMLEFVSQLLADDFNVVARVNDGRHAADAARRLNPDLIVLDVSMPELDGFETLKALNKIGSRAKVVFLTLHDADEYVAEALRLGASGYVLKSLLRSQLVDALEHALAGRTFVPAVAPLPLAAGGRHAAFFYSHERGFIDAAVRYLSAALTMGDKATVTLSASDQRLVAEGMDARGWDLAALRKQGKYLEYDADETVSRIVRDGGPSSDYITETFEAVERFRVGAGAAADTRLTLLGNISGLLCGRGEFEAALNVERLWDEMTRARPYLTVCAYPLEGFANGPREQPAHICAHHSCVSHATL